MFLAPPLAPQARRRGKLFRALTGGGLIAGVLVLSILAILLQYSHYFIVVPATTPQELYHRAWLMARDNIYDKSKLKDWEKWEHKFDGQIKTDEDALRFADEMIGSLDERYTGLLREQQVLADIDRANGHFVGIGVVFEDGRPVLRRVLRKSPAESAGLKPQDTIVSINGVKVADLSQDELVKALRGESGSKVSLEVERQGAAMRIEVMRGQVQIPLVTVARLGHDKKIGYIRLESFEQFATAQQMEEAMIELSDCRALVIDMRDNPGGFIHESVRTAALFLDEGTVTTLEYRIPGGGHRKVGIELSKSRIWLTSPLGPVNLSVPMPTRRPPNLAGDRPIYILVNGGTASAAEMFTAALVENRPGQVTVLGTTTFGKGIGQTYVPVGNGVRLRVTNLKNLTPNGNWIGDGRQKTIIGIKPNVVVEPERWLEFGQDNDNQLAEAVRRLK